MEKEQLDIVPIINCAIKDIQQKAEKHRFVTQLAESLPLVEADPKLSPILVVVLTASANASERTTAEQMWVVSYLVKPISAEDLATTIERILRGGSYGSAEIIDSGC